MNATGKLALVSLRPDDAETLAALHQLVMGEQDGWSADGLRRLLAASVARGFQVKSAEETIAFVLAFEAADEAEILALCVSPRHRRQGIGRNLLQQLSERLAAAQITCLHLEVRQSNLAARELYAKSGFNESGRRQSYYQSDTSRTAEDAIVMVKNLSCNPSAS